MLPRQQSKPQYQTWGKTYGTTTNPKKTQRAAITSYPNPHHPLQGWDQEMSAKPTHTKSEPKSNATTGNSSYKQDTRQLVTCEFQSSTSKPDKEVHFRYSRHNSESDHRHKIQQRYVAPKKNNRRDDKATHQKYNLSLCLQSLQKMNNRRDDGAIYPYAYKASTLGQKDHTYQKRTETQCRNG